MSEQPIISPVRRFFGAAMVAIGGMITLLCGGCSLAVIGSALWGVVMSPPDLGDLVGILLGGGLLVAGTGLLPTFVGLLLARRGWRILHPPPRRRGMSLNFEDPR